MTDLDPQEFRRLGRAFVDWVADYRDGLAQLPVQPPVSPGAVRDQLGKLVPEHPVGLEELLDEVDRVVVPATLHWQHPRFFGYFPANASLASLLGDLLSGGLGGQGMLWSTAPAGTEVEQTLLDELSAAFGLDPGFTFAGGGGGTITDSASSGVLAALLAALNRTSHGRWRTDGVTGTERVYVTSETHSSLAKAVGVAGLGARAVRVVPSSAGSLAMSSSALAEMIREDGAAGLRPVLICATIGTTSTGAIDPVKAIAEVAQANRVWLHVDAAWAGAAAICPEHRGLLDGVGGADSFCTNPHKWLLTAFDASLLWVRDAAALPAALSITPEYLRNAATDSGSVVDYRDWQVPLGRRFRALKLWAVLYAHGLEGLREHVRGHIAWAEELAERVSAEPGFALAAPRSLALVCLRLESGDVEADEQATRKLLATVNASGRAFLTHTLIGGRFTIRVAIGSVSTSHAHVEDLWRQLRDTAHELRQAAGEENPATSAVTGS